MVQKHGPKASTWRPGTPGQPVVSRGVAWGYAQPPHGCQAEGGTSPFAVSRSNHSGSRPRCPASTQPWGWSQLQEQAPWGLGLPGTRGDLGPPHFRLSHSQGLPRLPSPHAGPLVTRKEVPLPTGGPCQALPPPRGPASPSWSLHPKALACAPLPQTSPAPAHGGGPSTRRGHRPPLQAARGGPGLRVCQLVLGHGCTPCRFRGGTHVGGAECARAPALSSLRAPLLPRRLQLSQQEEWAMPGWTSLGPSQLLRGGQAGHDPLGC